MRGVKIFFLLISISYSITASAQRNKPAAKITIYKKFKPPKLFTSIGNFKDTMFATPQTIANIIKLPIHINDDAKKNYVISSYNFLYKKIVATEDEQTGKVSATTSIKSSLFKTTPLPELWIDVVSENLKPGEELLFFDVIVKDSQGRVMFAPNLKLIVGNGNTPSR